MYLILQILNLKLLQEKKAIVILQGPSGVTGNITFTQLKDKVQINGVVRNLNKGLHGFHIHEKGDLSNGCASTGSHFNPEKVSIKKIIPKFR